MNNQVLFLNSQPSNYQSSFLSLIRHIRLKLILDEIVLPGHYNGRAAVP